MATAMICGVSGQTGAYLARTLLKRGQRVVGTSRDCSEPNLWRLKHLEILSEIEISSLIPSDSEAVLEAILKFRPNHIYYLAGPSSVAESFQRPSYYMKAINEPVFQILEVLEKKSPSTHFINATSSDCFGNQPGVMLNEKSPLRPISPYAVAKASSFWTVANARKYRGLSASNAVLTNHESPLRGKEFVTGKLISGLRAIAEGLEEKVFLGSTSISRDWLWAGDVAEAIASIGDRTDPSDYVVASGTSSTLDQFAAIACSQFGLEPKDVIAHDKSLVRPSEIQSISLDPSKAKRLLGWEPKYNLEQIVKKLIPEISSSGTF